MAGIRRHSRLKSTSVHLLLLSFPSEAAISTFYVHVTLGVFYMEIYDVCLWTKISSRCADQNSSTTRYVTLPGSCCNLGGHDLWNLCGHFHHAYQWCGYLLGPSAEKHSTALGLSFGSTIFAQRDPGKPPRPPSTGITQASRSIARHTCFSVHLITSLYSGTTFDTTEPVSR